MQALLVLEGIPTLTSPRDSSRFDTDAEVLARWLHLADTALAMTPSLTSHRRHHRVRRARFGFGGRC